MRKEIETTTLLDTYGDALVISGDDGKVYLAIPTSATRDVALDEGTTRSLRDYLSTALDDEPEFVHEPYYERAQALVPLGTGADDVLRLAQFLRGDL